MHLCADTSTSLAQFVHERAANARKNENEEPFLEEKKKNVVTCTFPSVRSKCLSTHASNNMLI